MGRFSGYFVYMKGVKICIPLSNPTVALVKKAAQLGDFIEIWIDQLSDLQVKNLIQGSKKPVVVVCKDKKEKGGFKGSDTEKIDRLISAAQAGVAYIDCGAHVAQNQINRLKKILEKTASKLILSTHYFSVTPSLNSLYEHALKLYRRGADVVKIAAKIKSPTDTITLFELASRLKSKNLPFVIVGMGPHSKISRLGCAVLGGEFTFAAFDEKSVTASGQLTVAQVASHTQIPV